MDEKYKLQIASSKKHGNKEEAPGDFNRLIRVIL